METHLITGGTGFLGSRLAARLLGSGHRVILLVRGDLAEQTQRVHTALRCQGVESFVNVELVTGDVTLDGLGLSDDYICSQGGKISALWHLAASLSFNPQKSRLVMLTNLVGTRNIAQLALQLGVPLFHVSTAYVHGSHKGVIREEDMGVPTYFNNAYEESKYKAECFIRESAKKDGLRYIIFRPSILVQTEGESGSDLKFGFYSVVSVINQYRGYLKYVPVLPAPRRAFLNIVPVERVVDWMLVIARDPKSYQRTFHLVNPDAPSIREVLKVTLGANGLNPAIVPIPNTLFRVALGLVTGGLRAFKATRKSSYILSQYNNYVIQSNVYDMSQAADVSGEINADGINDSLVDDITQQAG